MKFAYIWSRLWLLQQALLTFGWTRKINGIVVIDFVGTVINTLNRWVKSIYSRSGICKSKITAFWYLFSFGLIQRYQLLSLGLNDWNIWCNFFTHFFGRRNETGTWYKCVFICVKPLIQLNDKIKNVQVTVPTDTSCQCPCTVHTIGAFLTG